MSNVFQAEETQISQWSLLILAAPITKTVATAQGLLDKRAVLTDLIDETSGTFSDSLVPAMHVPGDSWKGYERGDFRPIGKFGESGKRRCRTANRHFNGRWICQEQVPILPHAQAAE